MSSRGQACRKYIGRPDIRRRRRNSWYGSSSRRWITRWSSSRAWRKWWPRSNFHFSCSSRPNSRKRWMKMKSWVTIRTEGQDPKKKWRNWKVRKERLKLEVNNRRGRKQVLFQICLIRVLSIWWKALIWVNIRILRHICKIISQRTSWCLSSSFILKMLTITNFKETRRTSTRSTTPSTR